MYLINRSLDSSFKLIYPKTNIDKVVKKYGSKNIKI